MTDWQLFWMLTILSTIAIVGVGLFFAYIVIRKFVEFVRTHFE
jgi:hypothetical protein